MVPSPLYVPCCKVHTKSSRQLAVLPTEQEVGGQGGDGGILGGACLVHGSSQGIHPGAARVVRAKHKLLKLEEGFIKSPPVVDRMDRSRGRSLKDAWDEGMTKSEGNSCKLVPNAWIC